MLHKPGFCYENKSSTFLQKEQVDVSSTEFQNESVS